MLVEPAVFTDRGGGLADPARDPRGRVWPCVAQTALYGVHTRQPGRLMRFEARLSRFARFPAFPAGYWGDLGGRWVLSEVLRGRKGGHVESRVAFGRKWI